MAQLEIRLDIDPVTNRKNITIRYRSDEDALPIEHEEEHRRIVNGLIEGGVLTASEVGKVTITRSPEPQTVVQIETNDESTAESVSDPSSCGASS